MRGRPNALGQRFKELKAAFGGKQDADVSGSGSRLGELAAARRSLDQQVESMAKELGGKSETLRIVERVGRNLLSRVAEHMRKGRIDPVNARIRTSADEPSPPVVDRELRVGVYPVAGDPLQWGHMLIALKAMAEFQLDKIVFVIAGDDPRKPNMTPADFRHPMDKAVLEAFSPLFAYSAIAVGTNFDGETNIMRMLQLNPEQRIHSFYIVGGDHYNFKDKKGNDDTLLKIQKKLETPGTINPAKHKVSLAFIEREEKLKPLPTPLDVHILSEVGFPASSTMVRNGQYDLMPWAAYEYVRENRPGLYGIKAKEPANK